MTDAQLDTIYQQNLPTSHFAGLRGVWDAGYQAATGAVQTVDASASIVPAAALDTAPAVTTV